MRINNIKPKSSFLSMEKDMSIILSRMMSNERLKRLLYYTAPDALERENITEEQSYNLINKNIVFVPKNKVSPEVKNFILISFDNFVPNLTNPQFRNNIVEFDILCHYDQWKLKDFQLRPYKIAAELDSILADTHLTGIGRFEFVAASEITNNDEYAGLCLTYLAIHGEEDKKVMPNPANEERFLEDFDKMIQNLSQ